MFTCAHTCTRTHMNMHILRYANEFSMPGLKSWYLDIYINIWIHNFFWDLKTVVLGPHLPWHRWLWKIYPCYQKHNLCSFCLSLPSPITLLSYFPWLAHFRLSGMDSQPLYLCMVSVAIMYIAVNGSDIIFNLNSSLLFSSQLWLLKTRIANYPGEAFSALNSIKSPLMDVIFGGLI